MKKSHMWPNDSDPLGLQKFGGLAMNTSWMRLPQQNVGSMVPSSQNEQYRALAAAALQEIRTADSSKQLLAQSPLLSQLHFRQHQSHPQPQQLMQHINDVPGPQLQMSTCQTQTTDLGNPARSSSYRESDVQLGPPATTSNSFSYQEMMGRAPSSNPLTSNGGHQLTSMMRTSQNGLQPCGTMQEFIQVLAIAIVVHAELVRGFSVTMILLSHVFLFLWKYSAECLFQLHVSLTECFLSLLDGIH